MEKALSRAPQIYFTLWHKEKKSVHFFKSVPNQGQNILYHILSVELITADYLTVDQQIDSPICFRYWSTGNAVALASFLPILLRQPEEK